MSSPRQHCLQRKLSFAALAVLCLGCQQTAFAITDHFEKCNVLDPEFHDNIDMMVHQRLALNPVAQKVILQYVDKANDGALLDQQELDSGEISNYSVSQAGPKFAVGEDASHVDETYIVYTKVSNTEFQVRLHRYRDVGQACDYGNSTPKACFPGGADSSTIPINAPPTEVSRFTVYSTEDEAYTYRAKVVYRYTDESGSEDIFQLRFADLYTWFPGQAQVEKTYSDATPSQWARLHELRGATNVLKGVTVVGVGSAAKVYLLNPDNPDVGAINVTGNLAGMNKFNPYLFYNTNSLGGLQTNMVVFRHQATGGATNIIVYAQDPTFLTWSHYQTITYRNLRNPEDNSDETARPYLLSPEAFTTTDSVGTRTWLLFSSSDDMQVSQAGDGNIWVALVEPDTSPGTDPATMLRVNDRAEDGGAGDGSGVRAEGEVYFPANNQPVIFYSQLAHNDLNFGCTVTGTPNANWMLKRVTGVGAALEAL